MNLSDDSRTDCIPDAVRRPGPNKCTGICDLINVDLDLAQALLGWFAEYHKSFWGVDCAETEGLIFEEDVRVLFSVQQPSLQIVVREIGLSTGGSRPYCAQRRVSRKRAFESEI